MKWILIFIGLFLIVPLFSGVCYSADYLTLEYTSDTSAVVIEDDDGCECEVIRSMEVENPEGALSGITWVTKGVGYVQLYAGLSTSDVTRFRKDMTVLRGMGVTKVEIYINSPGGDAFTGLAMADEMRRVQGEMEITVHASGIVASAAVPVFAAASRRYASPGTIFMVHEAALWKWPGRETASDIRSQNELMSLLRDRYIDMLVNNSNLTREQWEEMEKKTTWFSAEKALEYGLVDEIK
jgi:ATP-dependent protease ClpP protease subunit